jgi:hypothetical protein
MTHAFEKAGLGLAPFRYAGMEEKVYVAFPGAPAQPAGTCDYCGNGIKYCCHVKSADGKEFIVGTDCIEKVHSPLNVASAMGGITEMQKDKKRIEKAKRDARAELKREERRKHWASVKAAAVEAERAANGGKTLRELEAEKRALEAEKATEENAWLISVLELESGDFCQSMVRDLKRCKISEFSPRCLKILRDIYSKSFGRGNSKAYWAAAVAFDGKLNSSNK